MELNKLFHPAVVEILTKAGIQTVDDLNNWVDTKVRGYIAVSSDSDAIAAGFLSGYISGFSVCMQHYASEESKNTMMISDSGEADYHRAVIQMLKDFGTPGAALSKTEGNTYEF